MRLCHAFFFSFSSNTELLSSSSLFSGVVEMSVVGWASGESVVLDTVLIRFIQPSGVMILLPFALSKRYGTCLSPPRYAVQGSDLLDATAFSTW